MEIALTVLLSIAILGEAMIISLGIWASKEDKKNKGKKDIDEKIGLLENELWEIDTKIKELQATFKCKKNRFDSLLFEKERQEQKLRDMTKEEE